MDPPQTTGVMANAKAVIANFDKGRIPGIIAMLFVAILPFVVLQRLFYGSVNGKYFFVVGAAMLAGLHLAYLLFRGKHAVSFRKRPLLWATATLLAVNYLAAFFGIYPAGSLWSDIQRSSGVLFLTCVVFLAIWASEILHGRDWNLIWRGVAVSSGLFAILSFFGADGAGINGKFLTIDFAIEGLTFGNNTFAGMYLLLGFILTFLAFLQSKKGSKIRWLFGSLAVIEFFSPLFFGHMLWVGWVSFADAVKNPAFFLGAARASAATALIVIIYLAGLRVIGRFTQEKKKKYLIYGWRGVWILGIFLALLFLFTPGSFVQKRYVEESTAVRIALWQNGLGAAVERPVLGWGPESFSFINDQYIDSQFYLKENFGEIWFDRAHNVVVDTLVSTGAVGALAYILLVGLFLRAIFRTRRKGILSSSEANILYIFPFVHFLQLQTSFDTIGTYMLAATVLGYVLFLERSMVVKDKNHNPDAKKLPRLVRQRVTSGVIIAGVIVGFLFLMVAEHDRQNALFELSETPVTTDTNRRITLIDRAFAGSLRLEPLRFASTSFINEALKRVSRTPASKKPVLTAVILAELEAYEKHYKIYLSQLPDHYRARMNYAYLLLTKQALGGEGNLSFTKALIADSYRLSPKNPMTHALDALAILYGGDVDQAKKKIDEALALGPNLPFTNMIREHIEEVAEKLLVPELKEL